MFARRRQGATQPDVQGSEAAGIHTLETEDTFPGVSLFVSPDAGGAGGHTGQTMDTVPFNEIQLYHGNTIEQAVKRAQGAEKTAEKAADEHNACEDENQPGKLVPEPEAQVVPEGGLDGQEGQSAYQRPIRTDELTKPRIP